MKKVLFGVLALAGAAVVVPAAVQTANAQVVVKERTVVRDGYHRRHHHDCRVVKVRTRLPNGNVIIKTRRDCR